MTLQEEMAAYAKSIGGSVTPIQAPAPAPVQPGRQSQGDANKSIEAAAAGKPTGINHITDYAKSLGGTVGPAQEAIKQIADLPPEKKKSAWGAIISGVANVAKGATNFLTSNEQAFGRTLGAAASTIDGRTAGMRQDTLASNAKVYENYLNMAKTEKDPARKQRLLAAAKGTADLDGIDIFNDPMYQKTAKQIAGEAGGVALDIITAGSFAKGAKALKGAEKLAEVTAPEIITAGAKTGLKAVGKGALKGAAMGAAAGGAYGITGAMQENKSGADIAKSAAGGAVTGALTGGVLGAATGFLGYKRATAPARKLAAATEFTMPLPTSSVREAAYNTGKVAETGIKGTEKIIPDKYDLEVGHSVQDIVDPKKSYSRNISAVNKKIADVAENQVTPILESNNRGFNQKQFVTHLNESAKKALESDINIKNDKELTRIFNNTINGMTDALNGIDQKTGEPFAKNAKGLWRARQAFDDAVFRSTKIFEGGKDTTQRKAVRAVREATNDYIANLAGADEGSKFKKALKEMSNMYTAKENLADNAKQSQLGSTKFSRMLGANPAKAKAYSDVKKVVGGAAVAGALGIGGYKAFAKE